MSEKKLNKKLIIIVSIIAAVALIATVAVIVMLSHRETVGDVLDLGDRYMSELDYESAIREYKRAIEIDPRSEDAYLKLAEAYIALGDVDSAIKALEDGYAATNSERILARLNELRGGATGGAHSPEDAESIVMASTPQRTTYNVGDVLDLTGLTLTVTYSDGATEVVSDGYTCEVETLDEAGTQEVTVRYGGAETKFTVTVEDVAETEPIETEPAVTEPPETEPPVTEPPVTEPPVTEPPVTEPPVTEPPVTEPPETKPPVPVTLSSISIRTNPSKTTYQVGETLDTSGLSLTATYSDGHSETVTSGFSCNPMTLDSAGEQTITVTYSGKTAQYVIQVEDIMFIGISIRTDPEKTVYYVGQEFDPTGLTLNALFNNGMTETITDGYTYSPEKFDSAGKSNITISYQDKTATLEVTVNDVPEPIPYWVIFTEGYRGDRVELTVFYSPFPLENTPIIWDYSLYLSKDIDGEYEQYYLDEDNSWAYFGPYGRFTDYASNIIASNLDITDVNGNVLLEKSPYAEIDWNNIEKYK